MFTSQFANPRTCFNSESCVAIGTISEIRFLTLVSIKPLLASGAESFASIEIACPVVVDQLAILFVMKNKKCCCRQRVTSRRSVAKICLQTLPRSA